LSSELKEELRRQAEYIKQLEARLESSAAAGHATTASDDSCSGEQLREKRRQLLESGCSAVAAAGPSESSSCAFTAELSQLLERRQQLVKQYGTESTLLATLMLRSINQPISFFFPAVYPFPSQISIRIGSWNLLLFPS
jgi:hypothetical protein